MPDLDDCFHPDTVWYVRGFAHKNSNIKYYQMYEDSAHGMKRKRHRTPVYANWEEFERGGIPIK